MSFYRPEQRCPRCRFPYAQGVLTCPNCGLALAELGGAPRSDRSGPPPSWQSPDAGRFGASPPADRFGSQGGSGPQGYRSGGQFAPGGSGPWGNDAGSSYGPRPPQFQQRPGSYSGAGERIVDADAAPTNLQRPGSQSRPSSGWDNPGGGQRSAAGYGNSAPGWDSPAGAQRPFADYDQSGFGRGTSSGNQRPPTAGRDPYAAYQEWARSSPNEPGDAYPEDALPYNRSQTFRGTSGQMYQPGGQTYQPGGQTYQPGGQPWQQQYSGAPVAYPGDQPGYGDPYDQAQDAAPRRSKKPLLIALVIIVVLVAVGGGAAYYFIGTRPAITVTSKYMVGTTPAGAASTTLSVTGSRFAPHAAVSFLIDGQPEPGHQIFQSDANGALTGDLTISSDWPLGQHNLTAKDSSGNTTFQGREIAIVAQGEAGTPGPQGAPADDVSFTIQSTVHTHSKDSGQTSTGAYVLLITGQPDPAGGKVCNAQDTGELQTNKSVSDGVKVTETYIPTCSGSYKSGKIIYKEIYTNYKLAFSNGVTCAVAAPFINMELDGSFTSATSISGTVSSDTPTITCSNGKSLTTNGIDGTWTGSLAS